MAHPRLPQPPRGPQQPGHVARCITQPCAVLGMHEQREGSAVVVGQAQKPPFGIARARNQTRVHPGEDRRNLGLGPGQWGNAPLMRPERCLGPLRIEHLGPCFRHMARIVALNARALDSVALISNSGQIVEHDVGVHVPEGEPQRLRTLPETPRHAPAESPIHA